MPSDKRVKSWHAGCMSGLLSMQPTGWFQVAWSTDLEVGDVRPLHYFGTDLVMFRGLDDAVHVLDAHCQHLGADLSHGGCVVEGGIQCPFHGWVWNGDGRNVRIPYEPQPDRTRRVHSWPVTERNECVYLWHDVACRAPLWPVPDAWVMFGESARSRYFRPVGPDEQQLSRQVRVHPQVVAESAVDRNHFRFVHHTPDSPTVLAETCDESSWHVKLGFSAADTVETCWYGLGLSFSCEQNGDGVQITSICPTPVDDTATDIFATYWVSESIDYDKRLRAAKRSLSDDIAIWKYQVLLDRPGLSPSEAADFARLRSWAQDFYSHA